MRDLRARLWHRELLSRLTATGRGDQDLWEWLSELEVEEQATQDEFRNIGVVFAQLSQVEVGVRTLAQWQRRRSGTAPPSAPAAVNKKETFSFNDNIAMLRFTFGGRFVKELKALEDVRVLRNHFAHGEVRVGVASPAPGTPLEPVIALVFSEKELPDRIHEADPLRAIVEADLDVYRAMHIASEGLEALIKIMLETDFSPYADDLE